MGSQTSEEISDKDSDQGLGGDSEVRKPPECRRMWKTSLSWTFGAQYEMKKGPRKRGR